MVVAARRDYPTIAAAREFPVVRMGEAVNLDILYNPTNRGKDLRRDSAGRTADREAPHLPEDELYLVVKPVTSRPFQPVGRVDGNKLTFPLGNDMVEIESKSNVLKTSETGTVWIFHDATSKAVQAVTMEVGMPADLLPKR